MEQIVKIDLRKKNSIERVSTRLLVYMFDVLKTNVESTGGTICHV